MFRQLVRSFLFPTPLNKCAAACSENKHVIVWSLSWLLLRIGLVLVSTNLALVLFWFSTSWEWSTENCVFSIASPQPLIIIVNFSGLPCTPPLKICLGGCCSGGGVSQQLAFSASVGVAGVVLVWILYRLVLIIGLGGKLVLSTTATKGPNPLGKPKASHKAVVQTHRIAKYC